MEINYTRYSTTRMPGDRLGWKRTSVRPTVESRATSGWEKMERLGRTPGTLPLSSGCPPTTPNLVSFQAAAPGASSSETGSHRKEAAGGAAEEEERHERLLVKVGVPVLP